MKSQSPGFAALASVIVISALLLTATPGAGPGRFQRTLNIADAENQAVSEALASPALTGCSSTSPSADRDGAITVDASATPRPPVSSETPLKIHPAFTSCIRPAMAGRGAHRAATNWKSGPRLRPHHPVLARTPVARRAPPKVANKPTNLRRWAGGARWGPEAGTGC